jgi:hypothetical protein
MLFKITVYSLKKAKSVNCSTYVNVPTTEFREIYLRQTPSPRKAPASTANSASCMKPVKVSIEKLRCDLDTLVMASSSLLTVTTPDVEYASLSRNEQGRCLNSAIESIFMDCISDSESGAVFSQDIVGPELVEERLSVGSDSKEMSPGSLFAERRSPGRNTRSAISSGRNSSSALSSGSKRCPSCLYTAYKPANLSR